MVGSKEYNRRESGQRVKQLRESCGYTQEAVADFIHMDVNSVKSIESGVRGMSMKTAIRLSCLFNRSIDYLVFGSDRPDYLFTALSELSDIDPDPLAVHAMPMHALCLELLDVIHSIEPHYYPVITETLRATLHCIHNAELHTMQAARSTAELHPLQTSAHSAAEQSGHSTSGQSSHSTSGQSSHSTSGQSDHSTSGQSDHSTSEQKRRKKLRAYEEHLLEPPKDNKP